MNQFFSKKTYLSTFVISFLSLFIKCAPSLANPNTSSFGYIQAPTSENSSVSQLSDIDPHDWAYEALKGLVERYGCIAGYPNRSFQGERAMSRYEFAAALNSCLNSMESIVKDKYVSKEDLNTLKRLTQDFQSQLSNLTTRINTVSNRVNFLEDHQFSSTLRMNGTVSLNLLGSFGGGNGNQMALQQVTYLGFSSSFTGKDLLYTSFASSNSAIPNFTAVNNGVNYAAAGGYTREGLTTWAYGGQSYNGLFMLSSEYIFPLLDTKTDKIYVTAIAQNGFNTSQYLLPSKGLSWEGADLGNGAISAFAQRNPLYRLGGGSGGIINYDNKNWEITAGYLGMGNGSNYNNLTAGNPQPGGGLFNGNSMIFGQINYTPSSNFSIAFAYRNNYYEPGQFAFNNQYKFSGLPSPGYMGTGLANSFSNAGILFNQNVPVVSNTYGFQGAYRFNSHFVVGAFGAKIGAICLGQGDAQIWSYAINLGFPDLGKEGNFGGIVIGMEPTLTGFIEGSQYVGGFKNSTGIHFEVFYRHQITNNISITPGFIIITAPNQNSSNPAIIVGVLRTTFSF